MYRDDTNEFHGFVEDNALRVSPSTYQGVLLPGDAFALVRFRVREAGYLASLSPEKAVKVGASFVAFRFFEVMALSTSRL